MWHANDDDESLPVGLPVVREHQPSPVAAAAAAAADSPASSCSSADRQPTQLDVHVNSRQASSDVTAPEQLRHRSSWPEDALAEHLMDMRSC